MDEPEDLLAATEPALVLRRLIASYRITHMIGAAARLGIADQLDAPRSAAELAGRLDAHPQVLERLLRGLAALGILVEEGAGHFALTPVGACLREDAPASMRSWALCESAPYYQRAWLDLSHAVQTGETAFEHAHGTSFYRFLGEHPDLGHGFSQAMVDFARLIADALAAGYDWTGVRRIVDVGGNRGRLLLAVLQANPALTGVLYDRPAVIAGAAEAVCEAGLGDRCTLVAGDFFEEVPAGGDLYLLSRILMDYDDERCVSLLRNCHRALAEGGAPAGRVLIVQLLMPPPGAPSAALLEPALSDVNMLVLTGGRERTEEEYRGLLARAGFRLARVLPSRALVSFLEGVRIAEPDPDPVR